MKDLTSSDKPSPQERQAVLDEIDFQQESFKEKLEEITELTRELLDADVSAVSFVGEECQWFCATQGSSDKQFPIEKSTCRFTIQQDGVFERRDLREDSRIPTPIIVDDRELRHYAGAPICLDDVNVGTLCMLKENTGELSQDQKDQLHLLTLLANRQIELIRTKRRAEFLSTHDPVTELPNRRSFMNQLDERLGRNDTQHLTVGVGRLFRFDRVEQSLGHELADRIFKEVANRLRDEFHPDIRLCALNRGTFAFYLPRKPGKRLENTCSTLNTTLENLSSELDFTFMLRISVGIAIAPEHANESEKLLGLAKSAMGEAEDSPGKNFQIFFPELIELNGQSMKLEKDFVRSLQNETLSLHYQPQIELKNETVTGSEALIRWTHSERGRIRPDRILELAEMTDREFELDCFVLRSVIRKLDKWQQHEDLEELRISLNVTYAPFIETNDFLSRMTELLDRHDVSSQQLEIEVTEQKAMKNIKQTKVLLGKIREQGLRVALDDFGTGFSSLNYLSKFPLDVLKVDRAFVSGVHSNEQDQKLVRSILNMSDAMELETVGEGPDEREEMDTLKEYGCNYAQGYYYSKPIPPEQFRSYVTSMNA